MNKAIYTLFHSSKWKVALTLVFTWCCLSLQTAAAQDIEISYKANDTLAVGSADNPVITLDCSEEDRLFADDNTDHGNYGENNTHERADTIVICPENQWSRVKVTFTAFDLAEGDTLHAFDGNLGDLDAALLQQAIRQMLLPFGSTLADLKALLAANPALGQELFDNHEKSSATGSGTDAGSPFTSLAVSRGSVSDAFGGWYAASCDPYVNESGCVIFLFRTNGDRGKGAGWEAWAECEERAIELKTVEDLADVRLKCGGNPFADVTIKTPYVLACGDTLDAPSDSIIVTITNESGVVKKDTLNSAQNALAANKEWATTFGIGTYTVTFDLLSDPNTDKRVTQRFAVIEPSMTCNDEVNTVFGAACQLVITPDMVLEDSCSNLFTDSLTIKFGEVVLATGTLTDLPVVTKDTLNAVGAGLCNGELTIEVHRLYLAAGACNNGDFVQTCETILKYTDNVDPIFIGHTPERLDTIVAVNGDSLTAIMAAAKPDAQDNCGTPEVTSKATDLDGNALDFSNICNAPWTVLITYTATDVCKNTATETDTLVILRPTEFSQVVDATLECSDAARDYLTGAPQLQLGNWKNGQLADTLALLPVDTLVYTAGYILRYTDQEITANTCERKIFRTWFYDDWCDAGSGPQPAPARDQNIQFINIKDQKAPTFTSVSGDTIAMELERGLCTKVVSGAAIAPTVTDECNPDAAIASMIEVALKNEDGTYEVKGANLGEANPLECGFYRITWQATDGCGNTSESLVRYINLEDKEDPVVTCEDEVYVSVSTSAGVVMNATSFYRNKTDNCGDPSVLIRRESVEADAVDGWGPWGSSIIVKCEGVTQDVNHNSFQVQVQVTDKNGRTNTCEVKVTPEDKIAPICDPLPNLDRFFCDQFTNGELGLSTDAKANGGNENGEFDDNWITLVEDSPLAKLYADSFGVISCIDNLECGDITVKEEYQLIEKSCGEIQILRRWSATDWLDKDGNAVGNKSQERRQTITINSRQDWTLTFPKDATVECRGPNAEGGVPAPATYNDIVRSGACDNFVLNVTADTFSTPGETCMKIIRNYELINWCVGDVNDAPQVVPNNGELEQIINNETYDANIGRFIYSQVIKLDVSDGEIEIKQNNADDDTENDIVTCIIGEGDVDPFGEADIERGLDGEYGCDTVRVFSATATNCLGMELTKFSYIIYVRDAGTDFATRVELDRGDKNTTGEVNVEPGKTYTIDFTAFDDCGNSATNREEYTFRDCKRPTPFVLNGLAVKLGDNCEVEVWAKDLDDDKTFDNCTPKEELKFFISREVRPDDIDSILATPTAITLKSTDVGTRIVYIYVVDKSNNYDFVRTTINVDNNPANCITVTEGDGMVAGHIVNPNGENVEQVSVTVAGAMSSDMTTGADGAFAFELNTGADYTVTPTKDMNPLNGVSTFDLVLISKHILGITTFDSPYKYIAADVNKSGTITAFDMVQLRQLILSINTEFSNNDSWRFVDAEYDFSASTTNPAAQDFAEFKNISQLAANMMNVDFVGVKVGDVNGNASANSLLGAESRTTNGTLNFNVTDRLVEAGETVTVDFTSANIATAQGYQFTMNFAGLDFDGLTEGVASAANFNTNLAKRGILTTSWNGEATADEVLFSLTFNATSTGLLSELITVSSDLTAAEAYNTDGELLDVNIEFATADVAVNFALGQNIPNPFSGETVIGFNLPTAGAAILTVMDVQGKVLKEIRGDYAKGYNAVTLQAKELTPGVLYYQLESADQVATKKMIIID